MKIEKLGYWKNETVNHIEVRQLPYNVNWPEIELKIIMTFHQINETLPSVDYAFDSVTITQPVFGKTVSYKAWRI